MTTDRILSTVERLPPGKQEPSLGVRVSVILLLFILSAPAQALMVGVTNGVVPDTSHNPSQTAGWTQGDPGWDHAVRFGYSNAAGGIDYSTNGVYLGDGWVLTAAHVGIPKTVLFQSGAVYTPVPHPSSQDQSYQIANPTWSDPSLVQTMSDLRLIRINGDPFNNDVSPAVPSLPIATQTLSSNDQVMYIGANFVRAATQTHFNVNKGTDPWTWTPTVNNQTCSGSNCYNGYYTNGNNAMRWGTNRIVSSDSIFGDGKFQTVIDGGTIAYVTSYDQNASTETDPFETLAVGGDSGSSVFYKRNGVWQLTGIMNAKYSFSGQTPQLDPSNTLAVFGNVNAFADLATYNDPNGDGSTSDSKIEAVKTLHADYSEIGDLNLDGVAGTPADLAAFVAGWRYNNHRGGTITSWMHGDVTHDGITDVNDFLRFRSGLSAGAGAELTAMMGSSLAGGIPEPSTALLTLGPVIVFALRARFRRPRLAA
jgi:trypsin